MRQPSKKQKTVHKKTNNKKNVHNKKYGTSKLEQDFAHNFLEPLGINYVYQYFVNQIGRYYDFAIVPSLENKLEFEEKDGLKSIKQEGQFIPISILVEIDGSFFHSDPRVVDENNLSPMQKHNKRVDEIKNKWALMHGIPIIRFWEKDIRENPKMVMDELKKRLGIEKEKMVLKEEKSKRHINKLKKKSNGS